MNEVKKKERKIGWIWTFGDRSKKGGVTTSVEVERIGKSKTAAAGSKSPILGLYLFHVKKEEEEVLEASRNNVFWG